MCKIFYEICILLTQQYVFNDFVKGLIVYRGVDVVVCPTLVWNGNIKIDDIFAANLLFLFHHPMEGMKLHPF